MPIRPTGRTAQSDCADRGSNPRWAATPPRTAAAPLSYSGWPGSAPGGGSTCSYSNSGREGDLRSRLLRVRLPPGTPGIRSTIHACLVATVSTLPRYGSSRGSIPRAGSSAPCDRSVSGKHASSPSSQGEFESRRSLWPAIMRASCAGGVTGSRARLRSACLWTSGFDSRPAH